MQVHFGEWRLDPDARQLLRGNEPVHVSPKAFELLKLLVEHRPQALSKTDLHAAIWPATFVSEASLAQLVSEIRAAIGDNAHEPRFLRTVHGFGYAFACDAPDIRALPKPPAPASPTGCDLSAATSNSVREKTCSAGTRLRQWVSNRCGSPDITRASS